MPGLPEFRRIAFDRHARDQFERMERQLRGETRIVYADHLKLIVDAWDSAEVVADPFEALEEVFPGAEEAEYREIHDDDSYAAGV